jgi:chromosome segregation ATPase
MACYGNRAAFERGEYMDYDPKLEARVVRLETAMESVQSDIREIKAELRMFRAEVNASLTNLKREIDEKFDVLRKEFDEKFYVLRKEFDEKFDVLRKELDGKFESFRKEFKDKLDADRKECKSDLLKLAAILVSAMLGLAGMMARGFGWI